MTMVDFIPFGQQQSTIPAQWRDYESQPFTNFRREMGRFFDGLFQAPDAVIHMFDLVQIIQHGVFLSRLLKVNLPFDPLLMLLRPRLDSRRGSHQIPQRLARC